jgi:hypothetical protein
MADIKKAGIEPSDSYPQSEGPRDTPTLDAAWLKLPLERRTALLKQLGYTFTQEELDFHGAGLPFLHELTIPETEALERMVLGDKMAQVIDVQKTVEQRLDALIAELEGHIFSVKVSKEEVLGVILAKYCRWEGPKILDFATHALDDANFHEEAAKVQEMAESLKREAPAGDSQQGGYGSEGWRNEGEVPSMSGAVSEPIVITISSQEKTNAPLLLGGLQGLVDYANLGIGSMLAGAGLVAFAMYARRTGIGSWRNFGGSMPKFSIVILMTLMLASVAYVSTFPTAYAAWDKGAQGIKVSGTSSSFNIAAAQTDLMGWRTTGTSDGTGASSQLNTYLSGQTTGTSYLWAQSVISFRASSSTYNSYTCNTWPSGSMTCDYVNAITLTPRTEFHTGKGLFGCNDGSAGWGFWINDDLDCYHSNPPLNQLIEYSRNIGASGYKRFNLYEYMTLSSDGKINSVTKLSRCTTQTSCGGYEQFFSYTSPTMTSSNQKFTSGSVGGTTYYPNAVFVGHSGGAVYTGKTGTYFEQTFDVSDSSTGNASYSKCTSSNVCTSPAEGNQDICWNTTIGDTGTARNFKSSAKYSTSCHSGSP